MSATHHGVPSADAACAPFVRPRTAEDRAGIAHMRTRGREATGAINARGALALLKSALVNLTSIASQGSEISSKSPLALS